MERRESKKKFVIIALALLFVATIGIGFAYLQKILNVNGTGSISSDFKVVIDSVTETAGADLGAEEINSDKDTVTFTVTLKQPGDSYEATITVKNTGTVDAKYITITPGDSNTAVDANVTLTLTSDQVANTELKADNTSTHTFKFKFAWANLESAQDALTATYTFAYTIEYQQA